MLDTIVYGSVTVYDIILSLLILLIFVTAAKSLSLLITRRLKKKMSEDHARILSKVVYFSLIIIALIIIMPILGVNPEGMLVAGGLLAVVIGFASQSIVGNLISGIFLLFERPVKIGDGGEVESTLGVVRDIKIISTTILTFDGVFVRLPNEKVFLAKITNYLSNKARRFQYKIGIRYKDDADKAIEVIKETIDKHPFALKNPEPFVYVDELGNSSVDISVRIWAPATEWWDVRTTLLWQIKKNLEENGIQIPFPQTEVWFRNELDTNVKESGK